MNAIIGSFVLTVGFVSSLFAIVTTAVGLRTGNSARLKQARIYSWVLLGAALLAFIIMERALITRDFEVAYVAQVGSSQTPAIFNFASLWSSLEGSILLWTLVLTGYLAIVAGKFRDRLDDPLVGWAMLTMFVVTAFFFFLTIGPAQVFERLANPPLDGPGPNPLLQNHVLMAFHPPMLYLGYVGFTVPFAFAIAALATGRLGEGWLIETRRWTLFAWGFLTFGIILGAWWSYEVLGWGGYWAWDPVENASLLPWLTGTAYLHSVMVQERRGMLRVWNLSLVCATFALTILGTFLTRSGVIASVHAFSDSQIGPVLLGAFAVITVVSVGLIGLRGEQLRSPGIIDSPLSREGAFLANNLVFAAFAFVVLLGTVFPLIVEAFSDEQISVGTPYFDRMTQPIGFVLLFLMAVAPVLPWRKASTELLSKRLYWPAWIGVGTIVVAVLLGARGWAPLLAFLLAGFAAGAALRQIVLASRRQGWRGLVGRANGGMIVHLGVIIIAVAFAASNSYLRQAEFDLLKGETASLSGHEIQYLGLVEETLPEKGTVRAQVLVDGKQIYEPGFDEFPNTGQRVAVPSVRNGLREDVYLTLLDVPEPGEAAVIRITLQPLVVWLWIGGMVMAVGTALAAFPGKRRVPTAPVSETVSV
ncbi:MAG: heme lyase CcmF/NrfE family subunit [Acidimicrobiales bacterium]